MIIARHGDILKAYEQGQIDVLAHGVNCSKAFGSGVAGQIARRWPEVRDTFMIGSHGLGDIQSCSIANGHIVNCFTQFSFGYDGKLYVSYDAIRLCMIKLRWTYPDKKIGIPKIGSGLGGGDWNKISEIIREVFNDKDIYVYSF